MAPETRSRGVPAPSRVYHSTPALQQVQFPARRKRVRRHHGDSHDGHPPSLKQQTLTQIDFVSSFDEDEVVTLSDGDDIDDDDDDDDDPDKENASPQPHETQDERGDEPESPVPKRARRARQRPEKRRRTMGDGEKRSSRKDDDQARRRRRRRRTLGDVSGASRYHTQTLTQFLGHHTSFVADSDDDDDHHEMDDGFLSWLERENRLKSPGAGQRATTTTTTTAATRPSTVAGASRENSVIPQTPTKGPVAPRADDVASLTDGMLARYEPPGQQDTPSKKRGRLAWRDQQASSPRPRASPDHKQQRDTTPSQKRASLVMQDSQATASWTTPSKSRDGAPTGGESPSPSTPTKSQGGAPTGGAPPSPSGMAKTQDDAPTGSKPPSPSTPAKVPLGELTRPRKRLVADDVFEIPDSDEEGEAFDASPLETPGRRRRDDDCYAAGAETQAAMQEMYSSGSCATGAPQDSHAEPDVSGPRKASSRTLQVTEPMRTPLHQPNHHHHSSQPSQPWESQRVPASILRSLPAPSARSDILLPVSSAALEALATGHCMHITAPFRIPGQVARFWLFEERVLRYMACVGPGEEEAAASSSSSSSQQPAASRSPSSSLLSSSSRQPAWRYYASQVYELNNPVCQEDMQEEGWIAAPPVTRYVYLPPAVVGQLLWNLRHALFADPVDEQQQQQQRTSPSSSPSSSPRAEHRQQMGRVPPPASMTLSQQVDAQIHSDMASSTLLPPDGTADDAPTRLPSPPAPPSPPPPPPPYSSSSSMGPTRQLVYPSQATTLSQASTPSQQGQQHGHAPPESATASESRAPHPSLPAAADSNTATTAVPCPFDAGSPSSLCSLPSSSLPSAVPPLPSLLLSSSQLLSKSQMLPDSLVRAYDEPPPHSHPHSHSHSYSRPEIWDSEGDEDDAPL